LSDKNPISALHELCTKLNWAKPVFEMHEQDVTLADPKFLMKVLYDFFLLNRFWVTYTLYPNFCYFYETNNFIKYHDLYTGNTSTGFINKGHKLRGFLLLWAFIPLGSIDVLTGVFFIYQARSISKVP